MWICMGVWLPGEVDRLTLASVPHAAGGPPRRRASSGPAALGLRASGFGPRTSGLGFRERLRTKGHSAGDTAAGVEAGPDVGLLHHDGVEGDGQAGEPVDEPAAENSTAAVDGDG